MDRFTDFAEQAKVAFIDTMNEATVEDFVRWLRSQKRPRNGMRTKNAKLGG